ncbi:SCO family protein [Alkalibacillus salilacus]|uniref:Protein SCO1/2 n=1 Tax=Alkalibacillus salilacus TaxID=284582 RepID=A0ABT9VBG4_9BACI|nr:SCO family protein [Alkalibacillus salilacus]MDQ0158267.1 protein SCO1/2 [Alkalibacillus salilacus]
MLKRKTIIAIAIVLVVNVGIYFVGTDGFTAFTAEEARTQELTDHQPLFPEVTLEDSQARTYPFSEFEGQYVFMTFFYSACSDVCIELEENMAEVFEATENLHDQVQFLSISFDPERDKPEVLDNYRQYFGSDGEDWRMARINNQDELQSLLDAFEVIVIPDGNDHYTHNSAFYLVNPDGRLIDVMDFRDIDGAVDRLENVLESEGG